MGKGLRSGVLAAAAAAVGLMAACLAQTAAPKPEAGSKPATAAGHWTGSIALGQRQLPITVDLAPRAAVDNARSGRAPNGGDWVGSMSVQGSTSMDVPVDKLEVAGDTVRFSAHLPAPAQFEGKLSPDGTKMEGTASNSQGSAPFQLTRAGEANVKLPPASSPLTKDFEGTWTGTMAAGPNNVQVRMVLAPAVNGTATATLTGDHGGGQKPDEVQATTVTIQDKELHIEARSVGGSYAGTLNANGEIEGKWTQGADVYPLKLKRAK